MTQPQLPKHPSPSPRKSDYRNDHCSVYGFQPEPSRAYSASPQHSSVKSDRAPSHLSPFTISPDKPYGPILYGSVPPSPQRESDESIDLKFPKYDWGDKELLSAPLPHYPVYQHTGHLSLDGLVHPTGVPGLRQEFIHSLERSFGDEQDTTPEPLPSQGLKRGGHVETRDQGADTTHMGSIVAQLPVYCSGNPIGTITDENESPRSPPNPPSSAAQISQVGSPSPGSPSRESPELDATERSRLSGLIELQHEVQKIFAILEASLSNMRSLRKPLYDIFKYSELRSLSSFSVQSKHADLDSTVAEPPSTYQSYAPVSWPSTSSSESHSPEPTKPEELNANVNRDDEDLLLSSSLLSPEELSLPSPTLRQSDEWTPMSQSDSSRSTLFSIAQNSKESSLAQLHFGRKFDIVNGFTGQVYVKGIPERILVHFCGGKAVERLLPKYDGSQDIIEILDSEAEEGGIKRVVRYMCRCCAPSGIRPTGELRVPPVVKEGIETIRACRALGLKADANRIEKYLLYDVIANGPLDIRDVEIIWNGYDHVYRYTPYADAMVWYSVRQMCADMVKHTGGVEYILEYEGYRELGDRIMREVEKGTWKEEGKEGFLRRCEEERSMKSEKSGGGISPRLRSMPPKLRKLHGDGYSLASNSNGGAMNKPLPKTPPLTPSTPSKMYRIFGGPLQDPRVLLPEKRAPRAMAEVERKPPPLRPLEMSNGVPSPYTSRSSVDTLLAHLEVNRVNTVAGPLDEKTSESTSNARPVNPHSPQTKSVQFPRITEEAFENPRMPPDLPMKRPNSLHNLSQGMASSSTPVVGESALYDRSQPCPGCGRSSPSHSKSLKPNRSSIWRKLMGEH